MPTAKIVHLTSVHDPRDERIFRKECRTLRDAGYEVTVVGPTTTGGLVDGIEIVPVSPGAPRLGRVLRTTREVYARAVAARGDVYHLHDPELIAVGLRLKLAGRIVVYDVHEDLPAEVLTKSWIPPRYRRAVSLVVRAIPVIAGHAFDAIVAATPKIAERFPARRTAIVQNLPYPSEFEGAEAGTATVAAVVAYVGGIEGIRGIREMVTAIALVPEALGATMVVVGEFDSPGLEAEMRAHPGWARVDFRGRQGRAEVVSVLRGARAGLVLFQPAPNHAYSQPTKLFEYMAAGIPVIASDFPRWREIVADSQCGLLVNPLDAKCIAAAIEWVLTKPADAAAMGRRGRQAVLSGYNWHTEGKKLLDLYARLLERRQRHSVVVSGSRPESA
jgi:glycosyltransferase involved in cell wall biosynthesis